VYVLTKRVTEGSSYRGIYERDRALFHTMLGLPVLDKDNSFAFAASCIRLRRGISLLDRIGPGPSTMLRRADFLQEIFVWYTGG
jgi:hypothetical protein